MALPPANQLALAPAGETLDRGPGSENRQYQHILEVAASQERRLLVHAALRSNPGYDLSDPWLVDATSPESRLRGLVPGVPCRLVGGDDVVAYLGPGEGDSCRVRLANGALSACPSRKLLPLPTRPARQGDWALVVDMPASQAELNGRRGCCGLAAQLPDAPSRVGFWVMFEASGSEPSAPPDMRLLAEANLVALPSPPPGATRTPWEARRPAVCAGAEGAPKALVDEAAAEAAAQQLAICSGGAGGREDDSGEESIELSGDDDAESSDGEPDGKGEGSGLLRVGSLVAVSLAGAKRHGHVEKICGEPGAPAAGGVTVRLLATGSSHATVREGLSAAGLRRLTEEELELSAVCSTCGLADPEDELLICEGFGRECTNGAHLRCLKPPLKAVPKGDWFCDLCGGAHQRKRPRVGGAPAAAASAKAGGATSAPKASSSKQPAAKASAAKASAAKAKAGAKRAATA